MFPSLLRFQAPSTIIEVGAHTGDDRLIDACRRFGHRLYMFEPNPLRAAEILRKVDGAPGLRVFSQAVSLQPGQALFHIADHDDCSSLQEFDDRANQNWIHPWHPYKSFATIDRIPVKVVRLDDFLEQEGIDTVDFLMIDAQGEDLRVVESLGKRMRDVKQIQIEVNIHAAPLYKNSFTLEQAQVFFRGHRFRQHVLWKQSMNREANVIFRNERFYSNRLAGRIASSVDHGSRLAYNAALKVPRLLAVTRMVLENKLGIGSRGAR
jgi:FkbM family methyltransferase